MRPNAQDVTACDTESVVVVVVGGVSIRERDARRDVGCQARPTNRINHTHSLARSHRRTLSLEHRRRPRAALSSGENCLLSYREYGNVPGRDASVRKAVRHPRRWPAEKKTSKEVGRENNNMTAKLRGHDDEIDCARVFLCVIGTNGNFIA